MPTIPNFFSRSSSPLKADSTLPCSAQENHIQKNLIQKSAELAETLDSVALCCTHLFAKKVIEDVSTIRDHAIVQIKYARQRIALIEDHDEIRFFQKRVEDLLSRLLSDLQYGPKAPFHGFAIEIGDELFNLHHDVVLRFCEQLDFYP